jgi:hypothetical protein
MHGTMNKEWNIEFYFSWSEKLLVLLKKSDQIRAFRSTTKKHEENKHIKIPPKCHAAAELPKNILHGAPKHVLMRQHLHFKR